MKIGLTLSPGGLLLPYHMGVLAGLEYNGFIDKETTPIIGSSAGSIAAVSYGCGLEPAKVLDATIELSDTCQELGGARGRLLPLLNEQMNKIVTQDYHFEEFLQNRPGLVGAAYQQIFPRKQNILQTEFTSRDDLFRAVSHSCMFPFFSTNLPCNIEWGVLPRLYVDGYFTVPRDRFGCPDFALALGDDDQKDGIEKDDIHNLLDIDATVAISVLPKEVVGLNFTDIDDCISPPTEENGGLPFTDLVKYLTTASSASELTKIYDGAFRDAEDWCRKQQQRQKLQRREQQQQLNIEKQQQKT